MFFSTVVLLESSLEFSFLYSMVYSDKTPLAGMGGRHEIQRVELVANSFVMLRIFDGAVKGKRNNDRESKRRHS